MSDGYWATTLQKRLSRRRAMAATGAGALGAAFLAACGGDSGGDSKGSAFKDPSGLLFQPVETTKQAVKGGIWQSLVQSEPQGFDPYRGDNITFQHTAHAYQRLLSYKQGSPESPADGAVEGDASQSWEVSPDKLTLTFKLRPNSKWDQRPPTNSRVMTTQDVKYSWEKISSTGVGNGRELVNKLNPAAPILDMQFPDNNTVVVKLKEPVSSILGILAYSWYFTLIPMEAEDKYDVRNEMRGTGPWMMTKWEKSVGYEYKRNPNYWKGDRPFLDGIDYPVVLEPAQQLAQFRAKRFWGGANVPVLGGTWSPAADLVITIKKESPDSAMRMISPFVAQGSKNDLVPSKLEVPTNPFQDVRVRYAMAMLIDRDTMIDAFGNVANLAKEGVVVESGWHSHFPSSWGASGVWLDPKAGKLGDPSKYWKFNPDEAAKLMKAAGKYPIETEYTFSGTRPFNTPQYTRANQVLIEQLQQGGHFKLPKINTPDHFAVYDPKYLFGHGQYEGISPEPFGGWPDADMGIWAIYMPGGRNDYVYKPVPKAHDLAIAHRKEFDRNKRLEIVHEWQKAMAVEMPTIPVQWDGTQGGYSTFAFHWPWLSNIGGVNSVITNAQEADTFQHYWYDKSKDTRSA